MGRARARTLILDAGALLALERGDRRVAALLDHTAREGSAVIPAGALAQAWRGGRRSARLGRLLASQGVSVLTLARTDAQAAGELCGATRTSDIVDASVVLAAREHHPAVIVTSDPTDVRRLDPRARIVEV
jgi:hypothetical protein